MSEDELVVSFASYADGRDCMVLAAAANQISSFTFRTGSGHRKSPDIVLCRDGLLMLLEAKTMAKDLFVSRAGELSDVDSLIALLASPSECVKILQEAQRRIRATFGSTPEKLEISCGVIAVDDFGTYSNTLAVSGIAGLTLAKMAAPPRVVVDPRGAAANLLR